MIKFRETSLSYTAYIGILILLAILSFGGLINHQFDTDDHEWLSEIPASLQNFSFYFSSERQMPIRPPVDILCAVWYLIWGANPTAFHLLPIALHIVNTILIVFVFCRLQFKPDLVFLVGLLFFVNVAHFRAIHWIIVLNHLLATFFILIFFLLYKQYLEKQSKWWPVLIALIFAIFSHPSVISVSLFCIYLTWRKTSSIRKTMEISWPLLVVIPLIILASFAVSPQAPQSAGVLTTTPDFISIFTYLFWFLSRLFTNAHWLWGGIGDTPHTWELITGALIIIGIGILYIRNIFPLADWGVWCIITVLPFIHRSPDFQFLPFGPSRQLYVATIGSSLIFAYVIYHFYQYLARIWRLDIARLCYVITVFVITASSVFTLRRLEAPSLYTSGRSYIARGNHVTGADLISRAFYHESSLVPFDGYLRLTIVSFAQGNPQTTMLEDGLRRHPDHPQLLLLLGLSYHLDEDIALQQRGQKLVEQAFAKADDMEEMRFDAGLALQNLASYYLRNNNYEKAVSLYEEALAYRPNYPIALFNMAKALLILERYDDGIEAMHKTIAIDPHNKIAILLLGNLLFELGRHAEAEPVYHQYLQLDNRDPNIYYNLGQILHHQDRLVETAQAMKTASELAPQEPYLSGYFTMGGVMQQRGHLDDARKIYLEIIAYAPHLPDIHINLGILNFSQQRYEEAVGNFLRATELAPDDPEVHLGLAQAYEKTGQRDRARTAYQRTLTLQPENPMAQTRLRELK